MSISGLDRIVKLHVGELGSTHDVFLFFCRQFIPLGQIVEVLLHNHIATCRECWIFAIDEGCLNSLLPLGVFCSVNKTDEVAAVEETETVHFVYRRDYGSESGHDSGRKLEAQIHALRPDVKEHITRSRDGVALSRADLPKLVQLLGSWLTEYVIPGFGAKPDYAGKASLKFTKTH